MMKSGISVHQEIVPVMLEGHKVNVPVEIEYIVEQGRYGADADGRRWIQQEEVTILSMNICPGRLLLGDLNLDDIEMAMQKAGVAVITRGPQRGGDDD